MKPNAVLKKLSRFIAYILGRRPDEFGLVPDAQGFVPIKELLKAITEEPGWRHVRRAHLNEILLSLPTPHFEIVDRQIRALDRSRLPEPTRAIDLPKLMHICVRRKAYPYVCDKGLRAAAGNRMVLSADISMAERIGRRRDRQPVLVTVQVQRSVEQGVVYDRCGSLLFLTDFIPTGCFAGPPLPRERGTGEKEDSPPRRNVPTDAGTFRVDSSRFGPREKKAPKDKKASRGKGPGWKRERRRQRKQKQKW